jgi:hypothetical protein
MEEKFTVGLLLIATNKYKQFVPQFLESADKHFFKDHPLEVYLFTDEFIGFEKSGGLGNISDRITVKLYGIEPYKFPHATLYRYKIFSSYSKIIDCAYVFYADVDTQFVDDVGEEILPDATKGEELVAVPHCGFYAVGGGSWGNNPQSTSYTAPEKRIGYYMGGFQGGTRDGYLKASEIMKKNIDIDGKNGVIAEHNDETHFNKYLSDLEKFKKLNPSYCMVEEVEKRILWKVNEFPAKLIALAKDHKAMRE